MDIKMANNKNKKNAALNSIKMQAANEVGVPLKEGYNGDLTAKQVGSVGGQMVKKMKPIVNVEALQTTSFASNCNVVTYSIFVLI